MSLNRGFDQNGWYEQIATEFLKYEWLLYSGTPNKKIMCEMNKAYAEIAKTLNLADIPAVKTEISNMKKYINKMMRRFVRLSMMNGGGAEDALNYAPPWFKLLDPHLKLLQLACKIESYQSLKYFNTGSRVGHVTSEIVRCACRAAARELARDCTNEGASESSKDRNNGEVSKLAKDSTKGEACDLDSNTNEGVSGSAIDSSDRAVRAAIALVSEDAVREYAQNVKMPVNVLHSIWVRIYAQSIHKLMSLIAAGDQASEKYATVDWLAADAGLLYDARLTVVIDKTFQSSVTLNPLILLYKLMVAAHEKIREMRANKPETKWPMVIDEREKSRHIWALVHINYILSGKSSSVVLLQRRWHEMKQKARQLLIGKDAPLSPPPILLALAKQFPCILTEELPPWSELVLDNLIYQESQLEPYRRIYAETRLEVPKDIGENLIFDDLYDWSDDEVVVIDEKRETIIIPDSDDEETDKVTNEQTDTSVNNTTIDNNTSELNDEYDSIKKLESIDLSKAKVKIIFENDSDDDLNHLINGVNDPDASKNVNSNITSNATEGLNLKCGEIIYESDNNDSDQNILNTNKKLLEVTQRSELNEIINNEDNKTNARSSVSNEIETQVRSNSDNQNGIDMDEVINDLRNKLINDASNKVPQNEDEDTLQNDLTSKVNAVNDENISDDLEDSQRLVIDDDEICNDGDESSDDEGERPDPMLVDEKLVKLSHVVLTPIEDLPEWRKHSRNNIIKCRQFSVKKFSKKVYVTSKQLKKCRPYIPKRSTNGIWIRKNQELGQIPKDIRKKINILSKRLNLPRTYFSREFWSKRNLELLELCRPFSIQLKRIPRVIKKIELADIDDVRRINRTILTAQVAPITVEANRVFVIDSSAPPTTAERIQNVYKHNSTGNESLPNNYKTQKKNVPSNLTVVQENEKNSDSVPEDGTRKSLDSNLEKDELPTESDIKEMIKTIVRKGDLPKASDAEHKLEAKDFNYFNKQKDLDSDLRQISKLVLMHFNRTKNENPNKRKNKKKVRKQPSPVPMPNTMENTMDSLEEWQRQKQQNLVYFNFNTNLEVNKKSGKNVNQYTNKKKKDKKDKSNAEVNLHKENEATQSKETSEVIDSSDCGEKVIKRTNSESVTEVAVKSPRLEISDKAINAPSDVIELSDDSNDRDSNIIPNAESNNINIDLPNDQNKSQINISIIQNTIQINGVGDDKQENHEKNAITFLSKVAANIQKNIPPAPPQNSNVFYVAKNSESVMRQTIDTNAQDPVIETKSVSNSTYYLVNVSDYVTGSNNTIISPLPESPGQMPVIQSVSSLSQLSHQSLNQMPRNVIDLNQALRNQTSPVIDLNQASLNQKSTSIYYFQPSPDQTSSIDLNQPPYPSRVLTVSPLPTTSNNQKNSANDTVVGNAFENLVKRPSNNKFQNTNQQTVRIAPMPLIQSVSSLRQMDQQNTNSKNPSPRRDLVKLPITSVTSRPI